jgi:hypothetical protein
MQVPPSWLGNDSFDNKLVSVISLKDLKYVVCSFFIHDMN